jgi:hypothetical protein
MTINEINLGLQEIVQDIIIEYDLIDTGNLLRSIVFNYDGTNFIMTCEYYWIYLDSRYSLREEIVKDPRFTLLMVEYSKNLILTQLNLIDTAGKSNGLY